MGAVLQPIWLTTLLLCMKPDRSCRSSRSGKVAGEKGHLTFEEFIKLSKEFFGEYSPDNGKSFDECLARCKDEDFYASESEPETSNADDLPF